MEYSSLRASSKALFQQAPETPTEMIVAKTNADMCIDEVWNTVIIKRVSF